MHRIVPMGNSYGYDLLALVRRLGTLRIRAPNDRLTLAFGACRSRMHSIGVGFSGHPSHHDRIPRSMCIADSDICSSHDSFGTYRRKCTGAPWLHGTWNRCGSDTRSCCESVQTRRILCHTLGNPRILSHVQQSHSKRRPCFDLNFPSAFLSYAFLTAAAATDPADGLPAVFRDPADGLSAAFLRPRCWTPDGRTGRAQAMSTASSGILSF
jgi:hypothetical protein